MDHPLVSVICLCYNHERFVTEAIESVVTQSYPNIEIIIVDDASTDDSIDRISEIVSRHPQIKVIALKTNNGICKAFNAGFAQANGEFIVDFATDDIFHRERIRKQVEMFSSLDDSYGVVYTDAIYIDEHGRPIGNHMDHLLSHGLIKSIPQGDVYADLLQSYFIASPTMLVRRVVLEKLQGYDENLSYEDFDFWIRSSRIFKYAFLNEKLTYIRRTKHSLSSGWYVPGDPQLHSTYEVCLKAHALNKTERDKYALIQRVRYEFRQSVLSENKPEAKLFYSLLATLERPRLIEQTLNLLCKLSLPLNGIRKIYQRLRYG